MKGLIIEGAGIVDATWRDLLDERQRKEIAFAELYARDYAHGTTGHNSLMLLSTLAEFLDIAAGTIMTPAEPAPSEYKLTFGKHSGKTLGDIYREDSSYIDWLAREVRDSKVREYAAAVMTAAVPIPSEDPGEELPF